MTQDQVMSIRDELHDISAIVHELRETKADKIKPHILITLVLAAATHLSAVVFMFAVVYTKVESLEGGVSDRYRGSQALADLALRDGKIDFLQQQIDQIRITDKEIDADAEKIRKQVESNTSDLKYLMRAGE